MNEFPNRGRYQIANIETIWPVTSFKLFIVHVNGYILMTIRGNEVKECKPNVGQTYKCTYITNGDVIFCYINNC
jgi:hypothetical protein